MQALGELWLSEGTNCERLVAMGTSGAHKFRMHGLEQGAFLEEGGLTRKAMEHLIEVADRVIAKYAECQESAATGS